MSPRLMTRRARSLSALVAGAALALTTVGFAPTAHAADPVVLNLMTINDFHGRIDNNTTKFATTVENLRAAGGEDNTLFVSAGDNISASLFASATANDNPTIDVLNALGLDVSTVGNHEFDHGFDDLINHVDQRADWTYLGANVYQKGTTTPALPEYEVIHRAGLDIGVIGAVTAETPTLVSPGGITSIDIGDPVTAVNRVAAQLTDGNDANGEADVLVATFHEGASGTDATSLAAEAAGTGAFAEIVNDLSPKVAAVITGHTHKQYVWDAPLPGAPAGCATGPGCTRPMIQTGEYGNNVGHITLTIDPDTNTVQAYTVANVARAAAANLSYPRVQQVKDITDAALAAADEVGKVKIGTVSGDITTAYASGSFVNGVWTQPNATDPKVGRDDRASESTLGNLVADALRTTLNKPQFGNADIGVVNPGGLRDELFYGGTGTPATNTDGVITYAEANAVLPFVNNLWTVDLTGAQFKQVLEQQWQRDANGNVPSRPFLQLGLSKNVHVVLDASRPEGDRVASVRVNGQPLDPAATYKIATFSFLGTGGDNFRAFLLGAHADTGLVDRDAWINYLGTAPNRPDFGRRQVYLTGAPDEIVGGEHYAFGASNLNLTSLGTPQNTSLKVRLSSDDLTKTLATIPVAADGTASVAFDAPADVPDGAAITLTAQPAGTVVTLPLVAKATTTLQASVPKATAGKAVKLTVKVTSAGSPVTGGTVTVSEGTKQLGTGVVTDGKASVTLPGFTSTGAHSLTVAYSGTATAAAAEVSTKVKVGKATPKLSVSVKPPTVKAKKGHATARITVKATGLKPGGQVIVQTNGRFVGVFRVVNGKATVKLPTYFQPGRKLVRVHYLGDEAVKGATAVGHVRVVR